MAPIRSKLMELSYSDPKFQIRLTGYADTVIIDSGTQQTISAIRFGGYPEVVRALSDAIYGGASVELKQDDTTLYLDCRPKGYRRLLSHDGIYAVATLMANDDSQTEENTADDSDEDVPENPRKCYIFCPPGDRASLFAEVDRKTAAPLIPEFQGYVLDSLIARGDLRQMKVLSFTERMEAWSLTLLPEDQNVTDILEQGLKDGRITIPGAAMDAADGFAEVNSVTSYLNTFGVTVADRIRSQFVPKFDPASEPLSEEILEVNDYIHEKAGYSLYDAQLAVAEAVKRQLCQHKMALIVAECGSGKTKLSAAAAGALNALKRLGTRKSFNLVMCPSHVTGKWVREIAETLPDTYGMHKTEQGEFIAPKHKIIDFQAVAAGFTPALPLIPLSLMRQIIAFFRSFMAEHGQEYEALVLIYWDKWKEEYLAYVPQQNVSKAGIHASLQENPYDDESRYIHYADIHSHNSMEAFFSSIDDADERGTGIYMVLGHLDHFYPEIAARICCGGSFVGIDPGTVVEGLEEPFPPEWCIEVSHEKAPVSRASPRKAEKTGIWGWKALDLLLGDLK